MTSGKTPGQRDTLRECIVQPVRSSDKNQELVLRDRKVFLTAEALSAMQTQFGFDDDDAKDRHASLP